MKTLVIEGRLLFPIRKQYHVTRWYSDGSIEEFWENTFYTCPIPFNLVTYI